MTPSNTDGEWPTRPVELNHLEAMGIAMSMAYDKQNGGLSEPQEAAYAKITAVLMDLMADLR